jgi:glycogen operon protein
MWYRPDGHEMTEDEWNAGWVRCMGLFLSGRTLNDVDQYGELITDDGFMFCLNPHHEPIKFYLPACSVGCNWEVLVDTKFPTVTEPKRISVKEPYDMVPHSCILLREMSESKIDARRITADQEKTTEIKHDRKTELEAVANK